jgi:hypothetical protein
MHIRLAIALVLVLFATPVFAQTAPAEAELTNRLKGVFKESA